MAGLSKYGRREWIGGIVILESAMAAVILGAVFVSPWLIVLVVGVGLLQAWLVLFFRDPERTCPAGEHLLVAPADGRVTDLTPIGAGSELGCDGMRIGVFMSVFDVHVNRAPAEGVVESIDHRPGSFLDARRPDASERNEATTIRLRCSHDGREMPLVVRQVAGKVARRIVTDLEVGRRVRRAERIGMIKFGSRVEVLVPREMIGEVRVEIGTRTRAGETVLLETRSEPT